MNATVEKEVVRRPQRKRLLRRRARARSAGSVDRNYPVYVPGSSTATNFNTRRPYQPGVLGAARVLESIFTSDYHGLQLTAEKRGARFSGKAYYSFGKAVEDVDYQGGGLPAVQNSTRLDDEHARTSADRTHSFMLSGVWQDRLFQGIRRRSLSAAANDWTLSAIVTLQSGTPFTITAGQDRNFDGNTNDRADLVGDPELDSGRRATS